MSAEAEAMKSLVKELQDHSHTQMEKLMNTFLERMSNMEKANLEKMGSMEKPKDQDTTHK